MLIVSRLLVAVGIPKEKKELIKGIFENRNIQGFLELMKSSIVVHGPTGCWLWTGQVEKPRRKGDQAYGKVTLGGRKGRVHKIAYEIANGPIVQPENIEANDPRYLEVDHKCRFPLCCNPDHMQVITKSLNQRLAKTRMAEDQKDPAVYEEWVRNHGEKIRLIFNGWKARNYRPDFWQYLDEYREFFIQWGEEIALSRNEIFGESIISNYVDKHPTLFDNSNAEPEVESDVNGGGEEYVFQDSGDELEPSFWDDVKVGSSSYDIMKELKQDGWTEERQRGSHVTFDKPPHPHIVTVPHPKKDIGRGLEHKIEREMECSDHDPMVK